MNKTIALILTVVALFLSTSKPADSDTSTIPYYIYEAAEKYNIDMHLMYAICKVESNCKSKAFNKNDGNSAQKSRGLKSPSYGLFQIKTLTAKGLGYKGTAKELLKPEINALYAAKLLNHLYKRYNNTTMVISAYNAGKYTKMNRSYVNKVLMQYALIKLNKRS